jgi:hypothetical protein
MPIAKYTHDLKSQTKDPVFIVRTPNRSFSGKRLGVTFVDGEATFTAKTHEIAKRFDEEFGYEVILPTGYKRWRYAVVDRAQRASDPAMDITSSGQIQEAPESFGEEDPYSPDRAAAPAEEAGE